MIDAYHMIAGSLFLNKHMKVYNSFKLPYIFWHKSYYIHTDSKAKDHLFTDAKQ
jgi:hypothetical protein